MKEIKLRHSGVVVKVSDEDYDFLAQWRWKVKKTPRTWYVWRRPPTGKTIFMHRLIMDAPADMQVDHIDGDGLNNVRENLRLCTKNQNAQNRRCQTNAMSQYTGVCPYKPKSKVTGEYLGYVEYRATISVNNKNMGLGSFRDEIEAAKAFDRAALFYRGEFARLNFPELRDEYLKDNIGGFRKDRILSSVFKGVTRHKHSGRWMAWLVDKGQTIYLGCYGSEVDAAIVRDRAALAYLGDNAVLNFPDRKDEYLRILEKESVFVG